MSMDNIGMDKNFDIDEHGHSSHRHGQSSHGHEQQKSMALMTTFHLNIVIDRLFDDR